MPERGRSVNLSFVAFAILASLKNDPHDGFCKVFGPASIVDFPQWGEARTVKQRGTRYYHERAFLPSSVTSRHYVYYSSWSGLGSSGRFGPFLVSGAKGEIFFAKGGKLIKTPILACLDLWLGGYSGTQKSDAKLNNVKIVRKKS